MFLPIVKPHLKDKFMVEMKKWFTLADTAEELRRSGLLKGNLYTTYYYYYFPNIYIYIILEEITSNNCQFVALSPKAYCLYDLSIKTYKRSHKVNIFILYLYFMLINLFRESLDQAI